MKEGHIDKYTYKNTHGVETHTRKKIDREF